MKAFLAVFLAAALPACTHAPTPAPAPRVTPGVVQAAADPDRALARRLVRSVWGTGGKALYRLSLAPTARARVYRYACGYRRALDGRTCLFDVVGEVDLATRAVGLDAADRLGCW